MRLKSTKGVAFLTTLVVVTVLLVMSASFVSIAINQNRISDIYNKRGRAFNIAEAGLDRAITWFRAQAQPPVGDQTDPWGGAQSLGGGTYSVAITDLGLINGGPTRRYKVTTTGTYGNVRRILTNFVQLDNYARYLWFTDKETYGGTTVWFFSLDHLTGPTQTNSNFNIKGNPQFDGNAKSAANFMTFYNNSDDHLDLVGQTSNPPFDVPAFNAGMSFGADPTVMPTKALNLRSASTSADGLSLTGDTTVVLNSNGTMNLTNSAYCVSGHYNNKHKWVCDQSCSSTCSNMALPANGALFVNSGTLTVSGTLKGKLSVGSSSNVVIPSNITYATNPRIDPASTDVLGIVSEGNVMISHGASADLEIDGCIMALGKSFYFENYTEGPIKDTLTVFGGIIQSERGPVGTFYSDSGLKKSGYSKSYLYDTRLLGSPPPFVPTTGDYITISYEED